ncbi:hypothetical protein [Henriciella sp.]|uniref:hypothetical protein n=1 Tax=Henriciella sp. TaxID=1968823 RepID=UPI0026345B54|nr:hypothetical protein [Henriciella sp.]
MRHIFPFTVLIVSTVLPAQAQETGSASTSEVYACAEIETDEDRLACYDAAVGRLKSAEEAGEVVTVSREEVKQVKKESFGFSIPSLPNFAASVFGGDDEDDIDQLTLPVSRVEQARSGFIVYLENGQVWRQIDNKRVYYSKKRGVEEATIKSAALGSYMMKFDDGVLFRVERVR